MMNGALSTFAFLFILASCLQASFIDEEDSAESITHRPKPPRRGFNNVSATRHIPFYIEEGLSAFKSNEFCRSKSEEFFLYEAIIACDATCIKCTVTEDQIREASKITDPGEKNRTMLGFCSTNYAECKDYELQATCKYGGTIGKSLQVLKLVCLNTDAVKSEVIFTLVFNRRVLRIGREYPAGVRHILRRQKAHSANMMVTRLENHFDNHRDDLLEVFEILQSVKRISSRIE